MRRRLQFALAWVVIGGAVLWALYEWIFVDEGLRYFSEDWSRVLVLLAIVVIGTPVVLAYQALSAEHKRTVALWIVGVLATGATGFAVYFAYLTVRLAGFLRESGRGWLVLIFAMFPCCILAAGLWWAFSRIRKRKSV